MAFMALYQEEQDLVYKQIVNVVGDREAVSVSRLQFLSERLRWRLIDIRRLPGVGKSTCVSFHASVRFRLYF